MRHKCFLRRHSCKSVLIHQGIGNNLPKQELMKPYQLQPLRPSSHFPRMLDAKLRVVPNKHTSMSLTLMFSNIMFTGVRSFLNLQNRRSTMKLLRKPKVMMKPNTTDNTTKPVGESFPLSAGMSTSSRSSLRLKL